MKSKTIFGIIIVIAVIACFIPFIPIQEEYRETESYNRPATYTIVSSDLSKSWDFSIGSYTIYQVVVKNTDDHAGAFDITFNLYDVDGLFGTKKATAYISAGATQTIRVEFDTEAGQDIRGRHSVEAPTIIDQRVVTKFKTVYKSIVEIIVYS